jgi:predicted transcriptional regulator
MHVATQEKINKVRTLVEADCLRSEIAAELGITLPTLRRHYLQFAPILRRGKKMKG